MLIIAYIFIPFFHPNIESRGVINATELVDVNNNGHIEALKKNGSRYAIRVQENGKYLLQLFHTNGSDGKFTLSKKQFDSMKEGTDYWFDIKVNNPSDLITGTVKHIYTYNPAP